MHNMGDIIREARLTRNLTQQQLADLTGISIGQIGNAETGHANLSLSNCIKVATNLNIDMNHLCGIKKPILNGAGLTDKQIEALNVIIEDMKKANENS